MSVQTTMTLIGWIQVLTLGGIVGALGQGARTIIGLKKLNDAAARDNQLVSELIDLSRIFISLAIGFVTGALAATTIIPPHLETISLNQIFSLAAAGYAGTDFLEGLIQRIPGVNTTADSVNTGGTTAVNSNSPASDGYVG